MDIRASNSLLHYIGNSVESGIIVSHLSRNISNTLSSSLMWTNLTLNSSFIQSLKSALGI